MNEMELNEGMNVIKTPNNAGTMHIFVYDGKVNGITIYNAKTTKKTHTNRTLGCSWVELKVKTDW